MNLLLLEYVSLSSFLNDKIHIDLLHVLHYHYYYPIIITISAITSGGNDPELLSLIVKKKPAEVEAAKQNLTNDLQTALGNKPNIKVVINEVIFYENASIFKWL